MKKIIDLQKKLVPEILEIMVKRYAILKEISMNSPIGRRLLSNKLNISERIIRSEIEFLKQQRLIIIDTSGMYLTDEGKEILEQLNSFISEIRGITELEHELKLILGIKKVIIIPGSIDESFDTKQDMVIAASKYFSSILRYHNTIGVTGGTTMHSFAQNLPQVKAFNQSITIVPARGGFIEDVEIQANNIAAMIAKKLSTKYLLLNVPDNIQKDILDRISSIPEVKSTLDTIEEIDLLVFGIGNAMDMAKRRKSSELECKQIFESGAVSEAFGHYFNINGDIVYETSTMGIRLEKYKLLNDIIGIAGGSNKAKAILSIARVNRNLILITDESAANYLKNITSGYDN